MQPHLNTLSPEGLRQFLALRRDAVDTVTARFLAEHGAACAELGPRAAKNPASQSSDSGNQPPAGTPRPEPWPKCADFEAALLAGVEGNQHAVGLSIAFAHQLPVVRQAIARLQELLGADALAAVASGSRLAREAA